MEQVNVKCPKCGWEFHAEPGAVKTACLNPKCEAPLLLSKKGAEIDTHRTITDVSGPAPGVHPKPAPVDKEVHRGSEER